MIKLLFKFAAWLRDPCKFRHKWSKKDGDFAYIRSADRGKSPGEELFKNPDGGWLRWERCCRRCFHRQYLRRRDTEGNAAEWADVDKDATPAMDVPLRRVRF